MQAPALLEVKNLKKHFSVSKGFFSRQKQTVKAVDGVSFRVEQGETLGLVGESGCGKTTLGRCVIRAYEPSAGEILYHGDPESAALHDRRAVDLASLSQRELKPYRRDIQMIFQDPFSSLNPRMTLLELIGEPLIVNGVAKGREVEERVAALLNLVGLRAEHMNRYPHAFSGGQRQRVGIARALTLEPNLIVCDEPVSALDVSVQAQVLNLLQDLQEKLGLTYLFIAHDLSVVEHICDRIAVMYVGQIVELAPTNELYRRPLHPYTEALMLAVPKPDPRSTRELKVLEGDVADAAALPSGCTFHPRCSYCVERCEKEHPELRELQPGHWVRCHRAEELALEGIG